jgi:hypothetical protein
MIKRLPDWLISLLQLFAEAFLGFIREQGREEVRQHIEDKTDETHKKFDRIDSGDLSADDAFERLRSRAAGRVPPAGGAPQD